MARAPRRVATLSTYQDRKLGTLVNTRSIALPAGYPLAHLGRHLELGANIARNKFGVAPTIRPRGRDCVRRAAAHPNALITGGPTNSLNVLPLLEEERCLAES